MEKTLNQLMSELQTIAQEHRQINEFFQGDFLDAVSRDSVQYPLMVVQGLGAISFDGCNLATWING
jgi:hypothetical protein